MPKKVLIGTPIKGHPTLPYVLGLMRSLFAERNIVFHPSYEISTYVNVGRNNLVDRAFAEGCDEILFHDSDVQAEPEHYARIFSHDVPIVGGVYAKRIAGEPQWTAHAVPDSKPDENGLQECGDLPTGFLRVSLEVFRRQRERFPWRFFQHDGEKEPRYEWFPMGRTVNGGFLSPEEAKLQAITGVLKTWGASSEGYEQIKAIIECNEPQNVSYVGEDSLWSRLARDAGFKLYADTRCVLRHWGEIAFPAAEIKVNA